MIRGLPAGDVWFVVLAGAHFPKARIPKLEVFHCELLFITHRQFPSSRQRFCMEAEADSCRASLAE